MTSFVYFVQAGPGGPVKIGKADNVEKRVMGLQTGCPDKLEILGVIECVDARARERQLHERFSALRIERSEWFRWSSKIAEAIANEARAYSSQRYLDVSAAASGLGLPTITIPDSALYTFRLNARRGNLHAWSSLYQWLRKEHAAGAIDDTLHRTCTLHNRTRVGDLTMEILSDIQCTWVKNAFRAKRGRAPRPSELRENLAWSNLDCGPMTTDPSSGRHLTGHGLFVLPGDHAQ